MSRQDRVLLKVLSGVADANIHFEDLCNLLLRLGFTRHTRSSHNIFRKEGIQEKINLQREGSHAKPYQVRQVRNVIAKYKIGGLCDV